MTLQITRLHRLLRHIALLLASFAAAAAVVAQPAPESGYILGPDDTVQVVVYGQTEFNIATRIKSDGTIVMPLIGTIKASGLTNIALAKQIGDQLDKSGLLKAPIVNVEVVNYISRTANVAGRVTTPGIIALDRPYRALEALLKSGWVRDAGASYVYLRRPGQPETRLEIEDLVRGGPDKDPILRAGDTLFVPDADLIFLSGQVGRPGAMPMLPNMTIRQAIANAGGVTATGSSNKVGLIRGDAKEIDVDTAQRVQKNDVIIVKERLF